LLLPLVGVLTVKLKIALDPAAIPVAYVQYVFVPAIVHVQSAGALTELIKYLLDPELALVMFTPIILFGEATGVPVLLIWNEKVSLVKSTRVVLLKSEDALFQIAAVVLKAANAEETNAKLKANVKPSAKSKIVSEIFFVNLFLLLIIFIKLSSLNLTSFLWTINF
jgi:hypothetical protein